MKNKIILPLLAVSAALFTGWATPDRLACAGRLSGAPGASRTALASCFAGPTPWMPDQF